MLSLCRRFRGGSAPGPHPLPLLCRSLRGDYSDAFSAGEGRKEGKAEWGGGEGKVRKGSEEGRMDGRK